MNRYDDAVCRIHELENEAASLRAKQTETQRWADIYRERALKSEAETESQAGELKELRAELQRLRETRYVADQAALMFRGQLGEVERSEDDARSRLATATELLGEARRALDDMLERYQAQGLTSIKAAAIAARLRTFLANELARREVEK